MKLAFLRAIYRHNYRVADQFFLWLDHKARRQFCRTAVPIVASCGDPECPVCRIRPAPAQQSNPTQGGDNSMPPKKKAPKKPKKANPYC